MNANSGRRRFERIKAATMSACSSTIDPREWDERYEQEQAELAQNTAETSATQTAEVETVESAATISTTSSDPTITLEITSSGETTITTGDTAATRAAHRRDPRNAATAGERATIRRRRVIRRNQPAGVRLRSSTSQRSVLRMATENGDWNREHISTAARAGYNYRIWITQPSISTPMTEHNTERVIEAISLAMRRQHSRRGAFRRRPRVRYLENEGVIRLDVEMEVPLDSTEAGGETAGQPNVQEDAEDSEPRD